MLNQPNDNSTKANMWENYENDPRMAYLEWLSMEARLLRRELFPEGDCERGFVPCNTFSQGFHLPVDGDWRDVAPPSTRAERVLKAAGVVFPEAAA
ncbi:hypothetical protein DUT91_00020 [Phyllobacterium salinisoli]|uniref:Uncharacterized protein n=1 Tax=Phyllobacterium salinisoli TaxID=1899321 RepID=A0A368K9H1_9HYPH|nr:hypothetical protein [Phyllobacterium salinisoli]RCS25255.1 hypothetical protein DUT91_00020 [Phyllobacterium salinisoli]